MRAKFARLGQVRKRFCERHQTDLNLRAGGALPFPTSHLASERVAREILVRGSARPERCTRRHWRRRRELRRAALCWTPRWHMTRKPPAFSQAFSRGRLHEMKIDVTKAPVRAGSRYPKPFDGPCQNKTRRRLAAAAGLTQFGVNLLELEPGAWSSQRHWHPEVDEFVYVLRGSVVLVTNS